MGLFNEIADTDTLFNWALLPQSIYEAEYRPLPSFDAADRC